MPDAACAVIATCLFCGTKNGLPINAQQYKCFECGVRARVTGEDVGKQQDTERHYFQVEQSLKRLQMRQKYLASEAAIALQSQRSAEKERNEAVARLRKSQSEIEKLTADLDKRNQVLINN